MTNIIIIINREHFISFSLLHLFKRVFTFNSWTCIYRKFNREFTSSENQCITATVMKLRSAKSFWGGVISLKIICRFANEFGKVLLKSTLFISVQLFNFQYFQIQNRANLCKFLRLTKFAVSETEIKSLRNVNYPLEPIHCTKCPWNHGTNDFYVEKKNNKQINWRKYRTSYIIYSRISQVQKMFEYWPNCIFLN